jgi:large subunit ribosomal protein L20
MVRVKRGNVARKRRKKILAFASGYKGAHAVLFRVANQQVMKALRYSYIGRKQKKRIFRSIWISRINATSRLNSTCYNKLINKFKLTNVDLNRKMLSQIALLDSTTFKYLINSNI